MLLRTILDALGLDERELWNESASPADRLRRELDLRFRRLIRLRARIERAQERLRQNEHHLQRPGLSIHDLEATRAAIATDRAQLVLWEEAYQSQLSGFTRARRPQRAEARSSGG